EGGVEVAVVEQVIGDLREDVVGRQLEADLRPVPAGVLEANRHRWSVGAEGTIGSMPEGHTIHRLARDHTRAFGRGPVEVSSPQGRFAGGAALVSGTTLKKVDAYGKHLFYRFEGDRIVHVHLGLFGKFWPFVPPAPAVNGRQVRMRLLGPAAGTDLSGPTA